VLLGVSGINTLYGKSHILRDVALDVREGEIVALLGRNGAGKSTLLKTIIGIAPPATGDDHARRARSSRAGPRRRSRGAAWPTCPRAGDSSRECRSRTTSSSGA
jgi:ABC-type branched-subunit amino acid transport system ATPase component